ncbi:MAG: tail fiber domain-containing protein [Alphaproteobacteria bacterium]|nr:tail fiber domain-containing protein [Alphaproteobacteria bacterium]
MPKTKSFQLFLTAAVFLSIQAAAHAVVGTAGGSVPVGTTSTSSMLGVYGSVSIGTSYTGTAGPTNGAIIQGNVGVGTTSPSNALDIYSGGIHVGNGTPSNTSNALYAVSGSLYWNGSSVGSVSGWSSSGNNYTTGSLTIGTSTAGTTAGRVYFTASGQSGTWGTIYGASETGYPLYVLAGTSHDLALGANNAEYMRILGSGNTGYVGIMTTTPTYPMDVNGTAKATSWSGCSDARWKKDIEPLKDSLKKVEQLQGVTFLWRQAEFPGRNFTKGRQVGLIAQDVEKVVPEVVSTDSSGYKSIEYGKLSPLLIEAVKDLKKILDGLVASADGVNERFSKRIDPAIEARAKEIAMLRDMIEQQRRDFEAYKKAHP